MALPAQDIYDAALNLSETERLDLAARLLASIDGLADEDWDAAWLAELDLRESAARSGGAAVGAEWSEVRARVRAQLARR